MSTLHSGLKIKQAREAKGWSQEVLADQTKLSVRTIQRIEQGQTQPKGNTLLQIKQVLFPNTEAPFKDEYKNNRLLTILNLSALSYLLFPIINIILPALIWVATPEKDDRFNKSAKTTLLIQTFWCGLLVIGFFFIRYIDSLMYQQNGAITATRVMASEWFIIGWVAIMYLLNACIIVIRSIRCCKTPQKAIV
ncbi:helix-turn-helix domain-containing protein [Carboxylicivirga sediminis]|uniref:Helix-turn-helix domain-containing protein n=1 Tax=Carboxylicivirga sediminis TaxID=2006564 RepID=A0A941IXH1_9BACT|nr:helix-turn-helix domain-containing protein [Carboxylicivirga sediminis]MBR8535588.1 helix-turn-helix domain-containing protein [Carboxylicivirga sediminis]